MSPTYIIAFFFALGIFFLLMALVRLRVRRPAAAARSGLTAVLFLGLGVLATGAGLNLWTYHRLTFEQPVATLEFEQVGPRMYLTRLAQQNGEERVYEVAGDQWQLEARVLKWQAPANLIGLNAQYRLERLTGRYANVDDERRSLRSAHDLAHERGLNFWQLTQRYPRWLPIVDAQYGNATFMPMADTARFNVSMTQSGLIARPDNDAARAALRRW